MKKLNFCLSILISVSLSASAQQSEWHLIKDRITTPWAEKVNPKAPLPEYPRPQMVRANWQNLNGLWSYAIVPVTQKEPAAYSGKILVPFAVESAISGVGRTVGKDSLLLYKTT